MTDAGLLYWLLVLLQQNPVTGIFAIVVIASVAYIGRWKGEG